MQNWIETTFNVSEGVTQAVAVILALAVVLLLFGLFIFILKRLMGANASQNRNRQPRIAVMDSAQVDARRRLVLIRRDNIEHLILVGGPSDVVVEQHIVRNAPLVQPTIPPTRPATPAPMPGHMPVKPATAPGPDIPPTPEDFVVQHEPAPPAPAVQARPPAFGTAQAQAPAQAPAQTLTQAPTSPTVPAQPSVRQPAEAPVPAPAAPAAAPIQTTAAKPQGVAPSVTTGTARSSSLHSGGGLNRAADLLRAATQNGFNRTASRSQSAQDSHDAGTGASGADAAKAPTLRTPVAEPPESQESGTTSAFKSLTRPFTPRDRPSYGGSITPPASGPAARAKTALVKPVDPVQPPNKIEPVLATGALGAGSQATGSRSAVETQAEVGTQTEDQAQENSAKLTKADAGVLPAADETEKSPTEATAADPEATSPVVATAAEAGKSESSSSAQREITLDLADLLEDPSGQEEKTEKEPLPATEPAAALEANADTEDQRSDTDEENEKESEAAPPAAPAASAAPVVRPPEPAKPAQKPGSALGDRNPIEEEMAKILDELGGQSPR